MKYANSRTYERDMPAELIDIVTKKQASELLDQVLGNINKNQWYAIRITESDFEQINYFGFEKRMCMEIEPAQERTMVYIPPEQLHLSEYNIPLRKKLKNCIAYLRDKTGGRVEEQEVKNECTD